MRYINLIRGGQYLRSRFGLLFEQLVKSAGGKPPKDADLEAAFVLADEDEGGTVDLDEFLNLYSAVIAGEVTGLSGEGFEKRATFVSGLQEKRERWREMTEEKVATATKVFNEAAGDAAELLKPEFKALVVKVRVVPRGRCMRVEIADMIS